MRESNSQSEGCQRLMALADEELAAEEARDLCARAAADPQFEARLAHQRELRSACARVMATPECCCPQALRAEICSRLEREVGQVAATGAANARRPDVIATIGRWFPAAVAAVLFVTALALFLNRGQPTSAGPGDAGRFASLTLPDDRLDRFRSRHEQCGRSLDAVYKPESFPREVNALPGALTDYFARPVAGAGGLDLSRIGYEYQVTGLCSVPGRGAVHVLYRALPETGRTDTLSLWLRPDDGSLALEPGRLYRAAAEGDGEPAPPLLIWREGEMVYYLMGNGFDELEHAASALHTERGGAT